MPFTSEKETEAEKNVVIKMGVTNASVPFLEVVKGQLISKHLFLVFNFFQKTNKIQSTCGIIVLKSNSFVHFWRKR